MYTIEINNLTKDYGHNRGVFNVSFKVEKGQVFGFLGPNGAGKSTTIRHLMGFSAPQSGHTLINGIDTFKHHEILSKVGYLPGEISLPSGLNSIEFIKMVKDLYKCKNDRTEELIQYFEFTPSNIPLNKLSLGDKRKLAIITAFLHNPNILVLDEPTSGLDIKSQHKFIEFIKSEKQKGKTILISSHIFSEVEATCDKVAIIKEGRIVTEIETKNLDYNDTKLYAITFKTESDANSFYSKHFKDFNMIKQNKKITTTIQDKQINELLVAVSKFDVKNFAHIKETLVKYFMKYYSTETKKD